MLCGFMDVCMCFFVYLLRNFFVGQWDGFYWLMGGGGCFRWLTVCSGPGFCCNGESVKLNKTFLVVLWDVSFCN
jgi:hypothetical protein